MWYNSLIKQTLLIMKISKKQILQLSILSVFVALLTTNALFDGATERMVFISNAIVAAFKYTLQNLAGFLDLLIYPASIFCVLGFVVVYVPMLFSTIRDDRHS